MGTERSEIARIACPCGRGEIVVTHCEPDHPWPTKSKWLETSLDCQDCRKIFVVEDRSGWIDLGPVVLVKRSEVQARKEREADYDKAAKELMSSNSVRNAIQRFVQRLKAEPSVAALYRLLNSRRLIVESEATFRKRLRGLGGVEKWARDYARYDFHLSDIVSLLGTNEPELAAAIRKVEALRKAANDDVPIVGKPIVERFSK